MKTTTETKTVKKINIGIEEKNLQNIYGILNSVLADEFVLFTKIMNFHWNVVGRNFIQLHKFFEEQYIQFKDSIDETAERIRALGGKSNGSLKEFLEQTRLKETLEKDLNSQTMLTVLLEDYESTIRELRKDADKCEELGDAGSNDFLVSKIEALEKSAWMIRAHIE